jgi:hypothetical protein
MVSHQERAKFGEEGIGSPSHEGNPIEANPNDVNTKRNLTMREYLLTNQWTNRHMCQ